MILIDFLEFVAAKFNQNLAFVSLFIDCYLLMVKINLH